MRIVGHSSYAEVQSLFIPFGGCKHVDFVVEKLVVVKRLLQCSVIYLNGLVIFLY